MGSTLIQFRGPIFFFSRDPHFCGPQKTGKAIYLLTLQPTLMMKMNCLIFLGLSSLCLISCYAWSEKLERPNDLFDAEDGVDAEFDEIGSTFLESSESEIDIKQIPTNILNLTISDQEINAQRKYWQSSHILDAERGISELYHIR